MVVCVCVRVRVCVCVRARVCACGQYLRNLHLPSPDSDDKRDPRLLLLLDSEKARLWKRLHADIEQEQITTQQELVVARSKLAEYVHGTRNQQQLEEAMKENEKLR